jgi:hypothetical protein
MPVPITAKRLVLWAVGLFPIVFGLLVLSIWLESRVPRWIYWKAALVFLVAAQLAYGLIVSVAVAGTLVFGFLFFQRRRSPAQRSLCARALVMCVSLLAASMAAEGACAIWRYRLHCFSALPIGGLERAERGPLGRRFLAPVAEFALPTDFPDPPGDRDIDLVVLGESSAEGVPYSNWLSIASILKWKISQAIPGRRIRTRVLARSGDTLEWQHRELANLARRPELLVIYCGHNELTSRLADSRDLDHYFDEWLPSGWDMFSEQVERVSPLSGLIEETAEKCRIAIPPRFPGLRKLVDVPCYTTTELTMVLLDFRRRLEAIVSYAERVETMPVLILPAANDTGFEPSRSFLPASTSRSQRESFEKEFLAARRLETEDPGTSIARYRALLARQYEFAETHFRLARLLDQTGDWEEAYHHYVMARNFDGYPMRCLSAFQQVYRDIAARHRCILVDSQALFHAIGRNGLLDDELFQDAMHPSLRGQIALAQAVLQELRARGALGWPMDSPLPVVDPAECAAHFRLGPAAWRVVCLWGLKFNGLAMPLRYDPSRRLEARDAYAAAADRIGAGEQPESLGLRNIGIPAAVPAISGTASPGT